VSKLHAYANFPLDVCNHVGALLAGALKAQLLRIYQIARASFTPTRIFHPRCSDHVGVLLAGALKPPLLRIYQIA